MVRDLKPNQQFPLPTLAHNAFQRIPLHEEKMNIIILMPNRQQLDITIERTASVNDIKKQIAPHLARSVDTFIILDAKGKKLFSPSKLETIQLETFFLSALLLPDGTRIYCSIIVSNLYLKESKATL
jgi:hypothetical protein